MLWKNTISNGGLELYSGIVTILIKFKMKYITCNEYRNFIGKNMGGLKKRKIVR